MLKGAPSDPREILMSGLEALDIRQERPCIAFAVTRWRRWRRATRGADPMSWLLRIRVRNSCLQALQP